MRKEADGPGVITEPLENWFFTPPLARPYSLRNSSQTAFLALNSARTATQSLSGIRVSDPIGQA